MIAFGCPSFLESGIDDETAHFEQQARNRQTQAERDRTQPAGVPRGGVQIPPRPLAPQFRPTPKPFSTGFDDMDDDIPF